jgi:hypothetical protein
VTPESVGQRGVFVSDELCGVREVISIRVVFPIPNLNVSSSRVMALAIRVSDESRFEEADEAGLVGGGS